MKLALLANADAVLAQRAIDEGRTGHMSVEEYRLLVLTATGCKTTAREAAEARAAAIQKAGGTPK